MKKLNVPTRTLKEANNLKFKDNKYQNKDWLCNQYYTQKRSMEEIAQICQCGHTTIEFWMDKFDFKRRTHTEASLGELNGMYGKTQSDEWKKKRSVKYSGKGNPHFGKPHSEETKELIRKKNTGENNKCWKGDFATSHALHAFLRKNKEKQKYCENCGKEKFLELSFNHKLERYTRNPDDYLWLCVKCHKKRDYYEFGKYRRGLKK